VQSILFKPLSPLTPFTSYLFLPQISRNATYPTTYPYPQSKSLDSQREYRMLTTQPPSAETKELKRRVRDIIDPTRNLGHVDSHVKKPVAAAAAAGTAPSETASSLAGTSSAAQAAEASSQPADSSAATTSATSAETKSSSAAAEKIVISGGEGVFFCRPGDEDCG
jgi:uncharacterized membrane protein